MEEIFPDVDIVPMAYVQKVTQTFIDRLHIRNVALLDKLGVVFDDISDHHGEVIEKKVIEGYAV